MRLCWRGVGALSVRRPTAWPVWACLSHVYHGMLQLHSHLAAEAPRWQPWALQWSQRQWLPWSKGFRGWEVSSALHRGQLSLKAARSLSLTGVACCSIQVWMSALLCCVKKCRAVVHLVGTAAL